MNKQRIAALALGLLAGGSALLTTGVYVLGGAGWALIVASAQCFILAGAILKGFNNG